MLDTLVTGEDEDIEEKKLKNDKSERSIGNNTNSSFTKSASARKMF